MSRTDKTRPWWVQIADTPGATCEPVHDHRWGPCTLPPVIIARPGPAARCHWTGTAAEQARRRESHGSREAGLIRREDRRRSRHRARHHLRTDPAAG